MYVVRTVCYIMFNLLVLQYEIIGLYLLLTTSFVLIVAAAEVLHRKLFDVNFNIIRFKLSSLTTR